MSSKRANGEGTIYQLSDGRWRVSVSIQSGGKLRRLSRIRRKRADCVAILDELRQQIGAATAAPSGTLAAYLERWLATAIRPQLAPNTVAGYERAVRLHIVPRLGQAKLSAITTRHIDEWKTAMITDGVKPRAAQAAYQCLRSALAYAVYPLRVIPLNPCSGLPIPKHRKKTMQPFEPSEVRLIMEDSEGTRWHALYAVAFGCGLRLGELFGLDWSDVDWSAGTVSVSKQAIDISGVISIAETKTRSSVRTVIMPESTKAALRTHRAQQIAAGRGDCQCVFPTLNGKRLNRANFHHDEWTIRLARCGLTHRPFHNTRHTFATLSLLAGVPVAVVAQSLGHSTPAMTYSTYSHVLRQSEGAAAAAMQRVFG